MRSVRTRFWVEAGLAVASGVLAIVTMFWHDWIEITGLDPDRHSGTVEWLAVAALGAIALALAAMTRLEWHRPMLSET
jgi:hypothetical protein